MITGRKACRREEGEIIVKFPGLQPVELAFLTVDLRGMLEGGKSSTCKAVKMHVEMWREYADGEGSPWDYLY